MKTATLKALAEPNRLQIVELLRSGPHTVGEITERLGLRQPQASKHLRILSDAEIVEVHAVANRRIYKLRHQAFQELDTWLDSFRRLWDEKLDRLDDYLQELQEKEVCREDK
ncbi:ArsR/SmtB family transcription factor [Desmospora activa]|uniref:ArsR family transcriptional regulator n=1 Tax=Desmospora activa DSM 45169 TaxID=1121389 RepID=A0A2T4Z7D7_9BACL|nr:metalloregulator ArsR/SmtB family transcription factor [Desmospora activa]PTM57808.1 ArsR family transcriptional regulator [Desmospora activa DSM 45169]